MSGRLVRVYFERDGDACFLSQLDLVRLLERAVRRSGLEVVFTAGFNPRVKLRLPAACPVGVASRGDWFGLRVADGAPLADVAARLASKVPAGIRISRVTEHETAPESGRTWLVLQVLDGLAATSVVATSLRNCSDRRFSHAVAHGARVIIELVGDGADGRPPRIRECIEQVRTQLRDRGFTGATDAAIRYSGDPPPGWID